MTTKQIHININISYDDFLPYYEGHVKDVVAPDQNGVTVRFPANALQPYLTHAGIRGLFVLQIDSNNKLVSCSKVDEH